MSTDPASTLPRVSMSHPERALQIWHILVAAARSRQTLTYGLIAEITGAFPAALGEILARPMRYCQRQNLPPLTVLVVQSDTGKPGPGLTTSTDYDADRERVYATKWDRLKVPTAADFGAE